jgi:hypothetical protein
VTVDRPGVRELAHGRTPTSPSEWLWIAAILAYYLLVRFLLAYAANRRAGADRPARKIWEDMRNRPAHEPRTRSVPRYLMGRAVLVAGMALFLPVALIPAKWIRVTILAVAAPLVVAAVACTDHRTRHRETHQESELPV